MLEQRRHQRIRFGQPPAVRIGYRGRVDEGVIENLSHAGLMVRTAQPLEVGRPFGCEFSLFGTACVDLAATAVSRVGDLCGARFQSGPLSRRLIEEAIRSALASGAGSVLAVHELGGRKVLRIAGGLNGSLRNDFMHALTRGGVDEIDLQGVTAVDQAGLALCLVATGRHGAVIGGRSACFAEAWQRALSVPGAPALD
ncbi:PilZ domain-containing protein [Azonexus sp.]|uniref:PilZ domain-containing protein n=1 Tax=Azonexus sp. TaxID=1872668 RepID=UPI0035B02E8D